MDVTTRCVCCGDSRGAVYVGLRVGSVYAESSLDEALCPWCVTGGAVRVVIGATPGGHHANAGQRVVTDARGAAQFTAIAVLDARERKQRTNFFTELVSRRQHTDHLTVAAEASYVGRTRRYVADLDYFSNGTNGTIAQLDPARVFGQIASGSFAAFAAQREVVWTLPGVAVALTSPGHDVSRFVLEPDTAHESWALRVAWHRQPEPVPRERDPREHASYMDCAPGLPSSWGVGGDTE
jgi:hypothetical protein